MKTVNTFGRTSGKAVDQGDIRNLRIVGCQLLAWSDLELGAYTLRGTEQPADGDAITVDEKQIEVDGEKK